MVNVSSVRSVSECMCVGVLNMIRGEQRLVLIACRVCVCRWVVVVGDVGVVGVVAMRVRVIVLIIVGVVVVSPCISALSCICMSIAMGTMLSSGLTSRQSDLRVRVRVRELRVVLHLTLMGVRRVVVVVCVTVRVVVVTSSAPTPSTLHQWYSVHALAWPKLQLIWMQGALWVLTLHLTCMTSWHVRHVPM